MSLLGGIISAGAGLLGGVLGNKQSSKNTKQDIRYQKEFAQHGLRWRVDDAKASGLHPLVGAGISPNTFIPSQKPDYMPESIARAGQDIGRSISRTKTSTERRLEELTLDTKQAELDFVNLKNLQLEKEINDRPQTGPPFPNAVNIGGTAWEGNLPNDYNTFMKNLHAQGVQSESQLTFDNMTGYIKYYPSQDIMDLISESVPASIGYYSGLAKYKYVMMHGKANPRSENGKMFKNEKARIESVVRAPVYLTSGGRWRLMNWRNR